MSLAFRAKAQSSWLNSNPRMLPASINPSNGEFEMTPLLNDGVNALSGDRALTAAINEANVPSSLYIRGYLRDLDYEKYGFGFLETEEQAIDFMEALQKMGCSKHITTNSNFNHFVQPGGLLDFLAGKESKRDMLVKALSIARRTHCGCHETGSYKLINRSI